MNNQQSLEYIQQYFRDLFDSRNINALDTYVDQDYFDDDIGAATADHIKNSKEFLTDLFKRQPTIGVDVKAAISQDNVITAYLEWYTKEMDDKRVLRKGVAVFVMKGEKILKRHTYIYLEGE